MLLTTSPVELPWASFTCAYTVAVPPRLVIVAPVSVTHYMDRDDQFLATISPRRYFCNQCHVVQTDAPVLVANQFRDIDSVLSPPTAKE